MSVHLYEMLMWQTFLAISHPSKGKNSERVFPHFAYGAQMNQNLLEKVVGTVHFLGRASLANYCLSFAQTPQCRLTGAATLIPCPNSQIEGAVYLLYANQVMQMSKWKQSQGFTNLRHVKVKLNWTGSFNDRSYEVFVTIYLRPKFDFPLLHPEKWYFSKIKKGANKVGVSCAYQLKLTEMEHSFREQKIRSKL